jgi:hypothetical protein
VQDEEECGADAGGVVRPQDGVDAAVGHVEEVRNGEYAAAAPV